MERRSRQKSTLFFPHMGIKLWVFALSIVFLGPSCHHNCLPEERNFGGGQIAFKPAKDTLNQNDTIAVQVTFPAENLVDSAKTVDLNGATNIIGELNIQASPKYDTLTDAADSFQYVAKIGSVSKNTGTNAAINLNFSSDGTAYRCEFLMIAEKRGTYILTMIDLQNIKKACLTASVEVLVTNSDPHSYILDRIFNATSPYEPSVPSYNLTHSYCFTIE